MNCSDNQISAGARYTKSIASLELRHKEHNNDPYSLHNNTIDYFTVVSLVTWPLNGSEAAGDLVLIQTSLLLLCKSSSYAN